IPDTVFIALGVIPLLLAVYNMWRNPRTPQPGTGHEEIGGLTFEDVLREEIPQIEEDYSEV
ncbi:MAG: hypothetical protein RRA94_10830, partial [Bacteroidota bacterium]|nr:hypothetical protein [Bacteroidota bacterium]